MSAACLLPAQRSLPRRSRAEHHRDRGADFAGGPKRRRAGKAAAGERASPGCFFTPGSHPSPAPPIPKTAANPTAGWSPCARGTKRASMTRGNVTMLPRPWVCERGMEAAGGWLPSSSCGPRMNRTSARSAKLPRGGARSIERGAPRAGRFTRGPRELLAAARWHHFQSHPVLRRVREFSWNRPPAGDRPVQP